MKIFWTIVIIIVLFFGYKALTKDTPAPEVNNEAAAVMSETEGAVTDQATDVTTEDAGTPAN